MWTIGSTAIQGLGERARAASRVLASARTSAKDAALEAAAAQLEADSDTILEANRADVTRAREAGTADTTIDRLRLDADRVRSMAEGLRQVAGLADPLGGVVSGWTRPNGLRISQVVVPLGVVAVIYENRPNVTADAAGLCLKSGNAALLRGSSAAIGSNKAIAASLRAGIAEAGLPEDCVLLVEDVSRETAVEVMRLRGYVDCLVPRGGPDLIASVLENATVPYVIDGDGNCHVYVDAAADIDMALAIVLNAKTQRPSVCNAAESLLVHRSVAPEFLPKVGKALEAEGVEMVGDEASRSLVDGMGLATDNDFSKEFLDLKISIAVVDDLDGAVDHIRRHGSGHTEAIVTRDLRAAERFAREVDAAAVMVNASTRFTDGEQFGFGAEIGISTQKLHARGPMGLRQLTTLKYVVHGDGQIRE
jgi:glutamate-5-semialdehyde dehydrogenase